MAKESSAAAPGPAVSAGKQSSRAGQAASTRVSRATLDRESILAGALELIDTDGLEALTMRRLGTRLGRDPMTLYRYTANRAAVLDGVVELVLRQLSFHAGAPDWQAELRHGAHQFRQLALDHPHVAPLLTTRPLATPLGLRPLGTLRPVEQILTLLAGAGLSSADALQVYRLYVGFLYGHILNELQEVVVNPEETDDLLRLGLHRLPARQFPKLRSLAGPLATYDGAAELDLGLDILLAGVRVRLDL